MTRIGPDDKYQVSLEKYGVHQMTFVGCSMECNILINMNAVDDDHLDHWIKLYLDFNPLAKRVARGLKIDCMMLTLEVCL